MEHYRRPLAEKQLAEPETGLEVAPQRAGPHYHTVAGDVSQPAPRQEGVRTPKRNPFGLGPFAFGALVAVITAIIVGAALGGGLGSQIHSSSPSIPLSSAVAKTVTTTVLLASATSTNPAAPTDSLSNYTVAAPNTVTQLLSGCPDIAGSPLLSPRGDQYTVYCNSDMPVGSLDANGAPIDDILSTTAYRFVDCIEACSNYNYYNGPGLCQGVSFRLNMVEFPYANCFLHNGTSDGNPNTLAMHGVLQ